MNLESELDEPGTKTNKLGQTKLDADDKLGNLKKKKKVDNKVEKYQQYLSLPSTQGTLTFEHFLCLKECENHQPCKGHNQGSVPQDQCWPQSQFQ